MHCIVIIVVTYYYAHWSGDVHELVAWEHNNQRKLLEKKIHEIGNISYLL